MSNADRVQEIFAIAIKLPAHIRSAYLDTACPGEPSIRAEVDVLLRACDEPDRDATLTVAHSAATQADSRREGPGTIIGPFKLLQLLGEGGFGSVFLAEQEHPVRRKVALKIIKLGMDTRQVVARFEQERQALAMMDHPNIARVLDAGSTDAGRPYFVMDLVKGEPIAEYCDRNNLSINDRLELFAQVCAAVQHAHTKGIIHRDLKPSNILVSMQDGRPSTKIIDFGIAKATSSRLTEKTVFTEHRQLIGTPEYMSPEQAEGSLDIDTRTDVYSLGVVLYELLTGSTPFNSTDLRSAAYGEIQRIIREVDPPKPSTRISQNSETLAGVAGHRRTEPRKLGGVVRGELDWIVMRALEKDRSRRYETANSLGSDIHRYMSGQAVLAAPPSAGYRARKFIRRNRAMVSSGAAVALALLVGVVAFGWQANVARRQRDRAVAAEQQTTQRAEELAQVADFQSKMLSAINPTDAGEKLMKDIQDRFGAALLKAGVPDAQKAERTTAFARELSEVNATDTAVELIDRTILLPAIDAVDKQFKDQPIVVASLRYTLSELYRILGKFDSALALQQEVLDTRKRILGEDHPDTLRSLNDLGSILESKGDLARAEACLRETVERRTKVLGADHFETLVSMSNLGNLLRGQAKFDEAEPLLRASLDGHRRVSGPTDRMTLVSTNTYGYLLIAQGKVKDAEPYWREAYEIGRRTFGPDDPDVLVWTNNLGGLLGTLGRHAESEQYLKSSMEAARRVHGLEHPTALHCTMAYGSVLVNLGRFADAEPYYREAMEARRRTLGAEHPDTLYSLVGLGNVLRDLGKFSEAESYLVESLEVRRRTLGGEHPATLSGLLALARLYSDQGKFAEAEAMYGAALRTSQRAWSEESPERLVCLNNIASALMAQDKFTEAAPFIVQCLEARQRTSGPDHPETFTAASNMARLLEGQGKPVEAESLYRETLLNYRRIQGDLHPNTLNGIANLAGCLRAAGRFADAEPLWREAVVGMEKVLGSHRSRTAVARMGLGRTLTALGRFAEAETELLEADRVMTAAPVVAPGRHNECRKAIATLYQDWDKAEPDKGFDAKSAAWTSKVQAPRADPIDQAKK